MKKQNCASEYFGFGRQSVIDFLMLNRLSIYIRSPTESLLFVNLIKFDVTNIEIICTQKMFVSIYNKHTALNFFRLLRHQNVTHMRSGEREKKYKWYGSQLAIFELKLSEEFFFFSSEAENSFCRLWNQVQIVILQEPGKNVTES